MPLGVLEAGFFEFYGEVKVRPPSGSILHPSFLFLNWSICQLRCVSAGGSDPPAEMLITAVVLITFSCSPTHTEPPAPWSGSVHHLCVFEIWVCGTHDSSRSNVPALFWFLLSKKNPETLCHHQRFMEPCDDIYPTLSWKFWSIFFTSVWFLLVFWATVVLGFDAPDRNKISHRLYRMEAYARLFTHTQPNWPIWSEFSGWHSKRD